MRLQTMCQVGIYLRVPFTDDESTSAAKAMGIKSCVAPWPLLLKFEPEGSSLRVEGCEGMISPILARHKLQRSGVVIDMKKRHTKEEN